MRMRMFSYSWCEGSSLSHSSVSQSSCVCSSKRSFWMFFAIPTEEWFSWEEGHQTDSSDAFPLCRLFGCWTVWACAGVRCGLQGAWVQAYNAQASARAEHTVTGHGYCWTQSGCSGSICHVERGGGSVLTHHWCHPSSHTRPAHSSVTQPELQPRSILLPLTATLSMLLQLLFTLILHPPKHSHVEHFYFFSIFTLGFSWMGMWLEASPLSYSWAMPYKQMGGKYLVYVSCLEFSQGFRKHWKGEKLLCFPIISGILKQNGKILSEGILSAGRSKTAYMYLYFKQLCLSLWITVHNFPQL